MKTHRGAPAEPSVNDGSEAEGLRAVHSTVAPRSSHSRVGTKPKDLPTDAICLRFGERLEPAGLMLTRRDGSPPQIHASRILHPTASIICSLLGSMTLTSVSLHTKVVMRMLDNGVRNLM